MAKRGSAAGRREEVVKAADITRIHYGYITSPTGYPDAGQPLPVSGFLIRHPEGPFLFDTGLSPFEDDVRERYHPRIREPLEAVQATGVDPADLTGIANCHFHADHAGGNSAFPGLPIYVQRAELEAAGTPDYTYPKYTHDFPDAHLEVIDGEHQPMPGLRLVPTPGHTKGHQSLLIETDVGVVMLAGQASNTTWEFSTAAFAERLDATLDDRIGKYPDWMPGLRRWNVRRALFAHDLLVWESDSNDLGRPQQR
jgi:N-acyl homoserine lactone hydrolase